MTKHREQSRAVCDKGDQKSEVTTDGQTVTTDGQTVWFSLF